MLQRATTGAGRPPPQMPPVAAPPLPLTFRARLGVCLEMCVGGWGVVRQRAEAQHHSLESHKHKHTHHSLESALVRVGKGVSS